MLADTEDGKRCLLDLVSRVEAATMERWRAVLQFHGEDPLAAAKSGLSGEALLESWQLRATTIQDQLGKRHAKCGSGATGVEQATQAAVAEAVIGSRSAAVGSYRCAFPDTPDPRTALVGRSSRILEYFPEMVQLTQAIVDVIPARARPYVPVDSQGKEQLGRIQGLKLSRVLAAGSTAVFSLRTMSDATRQVDGLPNRTTVTAALRTLSCPTMMSSPSGHLWVAHRPLRGSLQVAPMDVAQCAALMQSGWSTESVVRMVDTGVITESQARSMYGQGTAGCSMQVVADRLLVRLGSMRWDRDIGRTVGATGAGLNLTTLQLSRIMDLRVKWMADGCPIAGPAGFQLTRDLGHDPDMWGEATNPCYASKKFRVAMEVITLRCAPFVHGEGVEAALRELRFVMESVMVRRPRIIIYENTAGLWEKEEARDRVEMLLQQGSAYVWESMRISPRRHCGVGVERDRVFYVGILRGYEVVLQIKEQIDLTQGRAEEGEADEAAELETGGVAARRLAAERDREGWAIQEAAEARLAASRAGVSGRQSRRVRSTVTSQRLQDGASLRCVQRRAELARAAPAAYEATLPGSRAKDAEDRATLVPHRESQAERQRMQREAGLREGLTTTSTRSSLALAGDMRELVAGSLPPRKRAGAEARDGESSRRTTRRHEVPSEAAALAGRGEDAPASHVTAAGVTQGWGTESVSRPSRSAAVEGMDKRRAAESAPAREEVGWESLCAVTGVARERWRIVSHNPVVARVEWSARRAKQEAELFLRVTGLPDFYLEESDLGATAWYVQAGAEWMRHGTAAESPGLRAKGILGEFGWLWGFHGEGPRRLGRLSGVLLGSAATGSPELRAVMAAAQGDYCFERRMANGHSQVLDGSRDRSHGMIFINDARNIPGARNNATVDGDSNVFLRAKAVIRPLDGRAASWRELMDSEVFWDYGDAYWEAQESA